MKHGIQLPRNHKDYHYQKVYHYTNLLPEFCLNELKVIRTALVLFRCHVSDEAPALIKNVEQTLEKVNGLLQDF